MHSTSTISISNLLLEARQHPAGSLKRQRLVTQIIRQMQQSGKIWRDYRIDIDQYQEALQRTWAWFCQNLHTYDPTQASLTTWFNCTLKYRIKDVMNESRIHQSRQACLRSDKVLDVISNLPSLPTDDPLQLLTETLTWLQQQRSQLEQMTIRNRPDIDAYRLIVRRLPTPNQASWQELSTEFNVAIPTLSSLYRRQCLPLLRDFGRLQGWIDPVASKVDNKNTSSISIATSSAAPVTQWMRSA